MERIARFGPFARPGPQPVAYQPGVCNIGRAEIARRRSFGIGLIAVAIGLAIAFIATDVPPLARVLVLPILWGGLVSLEQARRRFCVAFAYAGIRSMDDEHATTTVTRPDDLARDRRSARRMLVECGVVAGIITGVLILFPV